MCQISDTVKKNGTRHNVRLIPQHLGIPYLPLGHLWAPTAILMRFVWGWEAVNLRWIEHPWHHIMPLCNCHSLTLDVFFSHNFWESLIVITFFGILLHQRLTKKQPSQWFLRQGTRLPELRIFNDLPATGGSSRRPFLQFCLDWWLWIFVNQTCKPICSFTYFNHTSHIWRWFDYIWLLTCLVHLLRSLATCSHSSHSWSRWCDRIQHSTASWQPLPPCARGSSPWSTQNCGVSLQAEIGKSWKIMKKKNINGHKQLLTQGRFWTGWP